MVPRRSNLLTGWQWEAMSKIPALRLPNSFLFLAPRHLGPPHLSTCLYGKPIVSTTKACTAAVRTSRPTQRCSSRELVWSHLGVKVQSVMCLFLTNSWAFTWSVLLILGPQGHQWTVQLLDVIGQPSSLFFVLASSSFSFFTSFFRLLFSSNFISVFPTSDLPPSSAAP